MPKTLSILFISFHLAFSSIFFSPVRRLGFLFHLCSQLFDSRQVKSMAICENLMPSLTLTQESVFYHSLSRLPVKTIFELRSVCKSWLSLTSNPDFIKTQLTTSTDDIISWLPKVAVYNIFLRLSVKDLSGIKSVCKSWLSLLSSRNFVNAHLAKSTSDPHFTHHRLIICGAPFLNHEFRPYVDYSVRSHDLILKGCPVYCLNERRPTESYQIHNPTENIDDWTYVVGYCNGLVCLACFDGSVLLWNPTTRKSRKLPEYEQAHTVFGFGYDESKDDFKVFSIIGKSDYKVSVYNSNSDCWRMIGDFPFGKLSSKTSRGQFAHGALHWLVSQPDLQKDIIVSLDMKTETHREIMLPNFGKDAYELNLGTFGNTLSVFCQHKLGLDIWVMKEYGVQQSWTKVFTFSFPHPLSYKPRLRPICKFVNGDIVLLFSLTVIVKRPDGKIDMLLDWFPDPSYNMFQEYNVYTYVESLVSPPKSKLSTA